ncbi:tRNA pseudouridine synthase A [Planctomycetota bacterium]|nr:tRNA pseudouridine synthase A [Planctomycetota bacterium]
MPRFALRLAYDGTEFSGWWRQPDRRTVAGELDLAFARIGEPEARAEGASRTDAGVHAADQLAHVDCQRRWAAEALRLALARHLPPEIAVRDVAAVADDWHAVAGVRRKTYGYRLDLGQSADPFLARFAWRPPWSARIDRSLMAAAVARLPGDRDWSAFVRRGDQREDPRCRITNARLVIRGSTVEIRLTADGFLYRLVRSLTGAVGAVACGAASLDDLDAALTGITTTASRQQAPARGLHLLRIVHRAPPF